MNVCAKVGDCLQSIFEVTEKKNQQQLFLANDFYKGDFGSSKNNSLILCMVKFNEVLQQFNALLRFDVIVLD